MPASPDSPSARSHLRRLAHQRLRDGAAVAAELGLVRLRVSSVDTPYVTTSDGRRLLNFASCCYLEVASRPDIIEASRAATAAFGTQLSLSPAYMALDLYDVLTEKLTQVMGRPVAVAATTTLAHFGTLPAIVETDDLVVVDRQAHNSVHMASSLLTGYEYEVTHIPHSDLAALEAHLLANPDRRVWYLCDGMYSMFGDTAPYAELRALADTHPNLWLYLDDAHGAGWSGTHGRGEAAEHFADHPRAVVTISLSKSWGVGGAAVAFPSEEMRAYALGYPGTFVFSGPLKPAELGAAVAAADYHLSEARDADAARLAALIDHTIATASRLGLELADTSRTPVFFIRIGPTETAFALASQLVASGTYVNVSAFPVVPRNQAGIRFTITTALTADLITDMLSELKAAHTALLSAT